MICPIIAAGAKAAGHNLALPTSKLRMKCLEEECAWWLIHVGKCAITHIGIVKIVNDLPKAEYKHVGGK